ncbi:MAG: hypothetical protein U0271_47555 [Polyangiaceae bacterium]
MPPPRRPITPPTSNPQHHPGSIEGGGEAADEIALDEVGAAGPPAPAPWHPGRHLTLAVPNFNAAQDPDAQMTSYLRLGAVPNPNIAGRTDAPRATGEDLAAYATSFLDDTRNTEGAPNFIPLEERQLETSVLHTRGGWRDHSDGNRVTTTRGDKVEVVRGNYRLVILGRQGDPNGRAGWDVSGGHIEGLPVSSAIEWVQTHDGTWKTVERSEKGDTHLTQHGNEESHRYGESMISTTGSEDEHRPIYDEKGKLVDRQPCKNPVISDTTWAASLRYQLGSEKKRVPVVEHETWVESMSNMTRAGSVNDRTTIDGAMTARTQADTISNTTSAALMTNVNLANMVNLNVGNMANVNIGPMQNVTIGPVVDLNVSTLISLALSHSLTVNLGMRADYSLFETIDLCPKKVRVTGEETSVAAAQSFVAGVYSVTAAVIKLG